MLTPLACKQVSAKLALETGKITRFRNYFRIFASDKTWLKIAKCMRSGVQIGMYCIHWSGCVLTMFIVGSHSQRRGTGTDLKQRVQGVFIASAEVEKKTEGSSEAIRGLRRNARLFGVLRYGCSDNPKSPENPRVTVHLSAFGVFFFFVACPRFTMLVKFLESCVSNKKKTMSSSQRTERRRGGRSAVKWWWPGRRGYKPPSQPGETLDRRIYHYFLESIGGKKTQNKYAWTNWVQQCVYHLYCKMLFHHSIT